jgi:hypothetical protein
MALEKDRNKQLQSNHLATRPSLGQHNHFWQPTEKNTAQGALEHICLGERHFLTTKFSSKNKTLRNIIFLRNGCPSFPYESHPEQMEMVKRF